MLTLANELLNMLFRREKCPHVPPDFHQQLVRFPRKNMVTVKYVFDN